MKRRNILSICLWIVGCCAAIPLSAQLSPTRINYTVIDLYALRRYPFTIKADSTVHEIVARCVETGNEEEWHQKTSVHFVANREFLDRQIQSIAINSDFIYKYLLAPYLPWLLYSVPLDSTSREIALPIGLQTDEQCEALYDFLGKRNVHFLIDGLLGKSGLFNPAIAYHYFFSGKKRIDGRELHEIAFYPENPGQEAFTGYLYITADVNPALVKAVYTRSNPYAPEPVREVLWTQTFENREGKIFPFKKEALFTFGDITHGSLLVNRTICYTDSLAPLTPSEQQVFPFVRTAGQTRAFRNLQTVIRLAMTDRLTVGGPDGFVEWGPVTQSVSYNVMEGLRLRAGGNTTLQLNPHVLVGSYLAYGTKDRQFKYRGDLLYSLLPKERDIWEFPKRLFSFSYARDLNIPGQELMSNRRDAFYNSFTYSETDNMSLQKMAVTAYEHELKNHLSFRVGGRYLHDQPMGTIRHEAITTSEVQLSLRYAPGEIFMQNRDSRLYLRRAGLEWNIRHRMGLKNVLGSGFRYHITDFSARKRWYFQRNRGYGDFRLSAGKVWNRVPFPLLFIPKGNQSYVFDDNDYNRMRTYEFVADQFVSGQADFQFDWSPLHWVSRSSVQTTCGIKALYGPLSDNNRPALHPEELFPLPPGVHSLSATPYVEMHIGLRNILNLFRVEWVHRITYSERGALLFGFSF
ncbi:MAG: hypothetical protein LBH19_06670 [Dysgonamonadaceae bacterium]|jgi:hypothetical protein|nr:hypothetical protein [Dysgonamonadaceae bacterium]